MSRLSPASLGCGALVLYIVAVLVAVVGGYWAAWEFTAHTAVPWMEVPHEWAKLTSVLLTIFVTGPVGVSLIAAVEWVFAAIAMLAGAALFARR